MVKKKSTKKAVKKLTVGKVAKKKVVGKKTAKKSPSVRQAATAAAPSGVPNIDYSLCQGCGGCAEAFPRLFEMRAERAWVINPESYDPVRDAGIMTICPYYAIAIERV